MDLKTFLLARITEDEAAANEAKDATGNEWVAHGSLLMYVDGSESRLAELVGAVEDYRMDPAWTHVERHDPARVLAECAAKRAIIEEHPRDDDGFCYDSTTHRRGCQWAYPCPTIRALATVYADHPDYQPEWAQEASQA